jgi:hypothetical protein
VIVGKVVRQPFGSCGLRGKSLDPLPLLMNYFWVGNLVSPHLVTRLLKLMNLTCRMLSAVKP